MRKILNGLIYDTGKADLICISRLKNDINYTESLYRTKNERFFKVITDLGNHSNHENLIPLHYHHEVINWLNENRNRIAEDVEGIIQNYFPDQVQEG